MSKKGQITTCDYLDFDRTLNRSLKIIKSEKHYTIGFLILVGINMGLRISDILSLKHKDFRGESIEIREKKTGKHRKIAINDNVRNGYKIFLTRIKEQVKDDDNVFISQKNMIYTVRSVNRQLKSLLSEGKGKLNISSHSLRKTFGRRVWENDGESEKSLIYLSLLFNHSSTALTRIYLGIRQQELSDIYMNL